MGVLKFICKYKVGLIMIRCNTEPFKTQKTWGSQIEGPLEAVAQFKMGYVASVFWWILFVSVLSKFCPGNIELNFPLSVNMLISGVFTLAMAVAFTMFTPEFTCSLYKV